MVIRGSCRRRGVGRGKGRDIGGGIGNGMGDRIGDGIGTRTKYGPLYKHGWCCTSNVLICILIRYGCSMFKLVHH